MKKLLLLLVMTILFTSCSTTNKMTDKEFRHALVGQNEMNIYSKFGPPTKTITVSDGGKVMIYEFYSKGMFLTPNKTRITYNATKDLSGNRKGLTFNSGVNTVTNDPKYTIYQKSVSYLKVFLDKQGNCFRFEQDLPQEQLDIYHERFKHFPPKDQ
jgi:outer membrane lipoprotein-sorting protein